MIPKVPLPGWKQRTLCYTTTYLAMHNPPPHYPQLARAWPHVYCVNKVSLLLDHELTTPALELLILFPKIMGP